MYNPFTNASGSLRLLERPGSGWDEPRIWRPDLARTMGGAADTGCDEEGTGGACPPMQIYGQMAIARIWAYP